MNFRIFSHRHKLYTNSPLWPSNQRTWSDWMLTPDGRILELIFDGQSGNEELSEIIGYQNHDKRNFSIEPFTGFYDCQNKRIYLGDIVKLQCFNLDYEIVWHVDRFGMKPLFETTTPYDGIPQHIRGQKDFSVDWLVVNTKHNVEYCD